MMMIMMMMMILEGVFMVIYQPWILYAEYNKTRGELQQNAEKYIWRKVK